jgi:hypothetical protein
LWQNHDKLEKAKQLTFTPGIETCGLSSSEMMVMMMRKYENGDDP